MKIIYVYDALCGWCYGFSPVMSQFQEKYKNTMNFEVISGGMITDSRIGPIGEVASYINSAYKTVENTTGVKFGNAFLTKTLKNGTAIFTSVPPAIALSVFKREGQQKNHIQFAAELQKAIYYDGIEPNDLQAYGQVASTFGLDAEVFVEKMKEPIYQNYAEEDFRKSVALGVNGFPSVFIEENGMYTQIARGYVSWNTLENNFIALKNK